MTSPTPLTANGYDQDSPSRHRAVTIRGEPAGRSPIGLNPQTRSKIFEPPAEKKPISTYSRGAANIVGAMKRHRVRRLAVVSSAGVAPHSYSDGGFLFNRVLLPYVTRVLGKTMYDDMRRMETLVRASDLDWTIVRPNGLYHLPSPTDYTLVEGHADGRFTARVDLAASMLALLDDDRYLRTTVSVITTVDNPTLLQWIRREALAKS
ncbi:NAD(P)-dependent oxidoreductase [Micromonospora eburnea]|uniref:NAD(P)H-binding n=1 Tax=Micromonospora eburnea TaxID=227316 RepID=A0A1C6U351_9ACTN|nr:NAD(P)H-binding protein [Micromonospora eburnea]SCL48341.1 NAD(P)H-binding [Micromonospora eburnea]